MLKNGHIESFRKNNILMAVAGLK